MFVYIGEWKDNIEWSRIMVVVVCECVCLCVCVCILGEWMGKGRFPLKYSYVITRLSKDT